MSAPLDAAVRERALDPASSFIVQAPAGSGKTELLTRRVLTLLTQVEEPESILAITFTRKAASEMRQRVVETLGAAANGKVGANEHEEASLALARDVLQRDAHYDWQLLDNPQRLNLRTIDALATQLAHRLPVVSALGAPLGITDDANALYRDVAARFISAEIEQMPRVMLQLGNQLEKAQTLLAALLANRDQWKRHVSAFQSEAADPEALRQALEGMLEELVEARLATLIHHLPDGLSEELAPLLRRAAVCLTVVRECDLADLPAPFDKWVSLIDLPGDAAADVSAWGAVAEVLLTQKDERRKSVTKALGFPAKGDAAAHDATPSELDTHKKAMVSVLERLVDAPEFLAALGEVRQLPAARYGDEQWELLAELLGVLPSLLVELQLAFSEAGVVDFVEMAERAQRALGTPDEPTDLALSMDLSIRHILVDEFQDTSQTQIRLFRQLVAGWSDGDGRTFFAVGDPMQSIYRFRDGDVGLFSEAQRHGIADIALEPLTLHVNFRSSPAVTSWVNDSFQAIFPSEADPEIGAVPYSPSTAFLTLPGEVRIWPLIDADAEAESHAVAERVTEALTRDPEHTVAILLRSRSQAVLIFDALRSVGVPYQSIDMDLLGSRPAVRDLLSLCLALRYPHDRLHWLAVLRSPGCGLQLTDLHALMEGAGRHQSVISLLRDPDRQAAMSADGQERSQRLLAVVKPALKRAPRSQLMPWVESCWLTLGGPAACQGAVDLEGAERCLQFLYSLEASGQRWQHSTLEAGIRTLYAAPDADPDCRVQVMTLHKAKGLEFDTVILPSLDRQSASDGVQLLNWFESSIEGEERLLLAPFEEQGVSTRRRDPLNRLVRQARQRCDEQEKLRLLYVACTRAKCELHLIARASHGADGTLKAPNRGSLLSPLWPLVEPLFQSAAKPDTHELIAQESFPDSILDTQESSAEIPDTHTSDMQATQTPQLVVPLHVRVVSGWQPPAANAYTWPSTHAQRLSSEVPLSFDWASPEARDIGTVVHDHLQRLSDPALRAAGEVGVQDGSLERVVQRQLQIMGVSEGRAVAASGRVMRALVNTLEDERGRWCLDVHDQARSEWALSVPHAEAGFVGVRKVVIDRTFVDEAGTRWIIDFKSSEHEGGNREGFLDKEQARYEDQLNGYAVVLRALEDRPIRLGLWFPMLKGWREWQPPI